MALSAERFSGSVQFPAYFLTKASNLLASTFDLTFVGKLQGKLAQKSLPGLGWRTHSVKKKDTSAMFPIRFHFIHTRIQ
jgi:hypothetical protein